MKNLLTILFCCCFSVFSFSQSQTETEDIQPFFTSETLEETPSSEKKCENESQESKDHREKIINSHGDPNTVTSGCRNDNSSHGKNRGATDFSTKNMTDKEAKEKAKKISEETDSFCQFEKIREDGSQTDFRYQNGQNAGTKNHGTKKKNVTGSHIHCQKPKPRKITKNKSTKKCEIQKTAGYATRPNRIQ